MANVSLASMDAKMITLLPKATYLENMALVLLDRTQVEQLVARLVDCAAWDALASVYTFSAAKRKKKEETAMMTMASLAPFMSLKSRKSTKRPKSLRIRPSNLSSLQCRTCNQVCSPAWA